MIFFEFLSSSLIHTELLLWQSCKNLKCSVELRSIELTKKITNNYRDTRAQNIFHIQCRIGSKVQLTWAWNCHKLNRLNSSNFDLSYLYRPNQQKKVAASTIKLSCTGEGTSWMWADVALALSFYLPFLPRFTFIAHKLQSDVPENANNLEYMFGCECLTSRHGISRKQIDFQIAQ